MGDLRPDNGGGWPPEDGPDGLSGIPPEWGTIVIPDDAAELDSEAHALRRELRWHARRARLRAKLGLKPRPLGPSQRSPSGLPIMIMLIAVLTTLISLIAVTWGPRSSQPLPNTSRPTSGTASAEPAGPRVADLTVIAAGDHTVRLGTVLPAVILLIDGCTCSALVLDAAATVPAGVFVLAIGQTAPTIAQAPANVHSLADPTGALRARFAPNSTPGPAAVAIMVDSAGVVRTTVQTARTIDDLRTGIAQLVSH